MWQTSGAQAHKMKTRWSHHCQKVLMFLLNQEIKRWCRFTVFIFFPPLECNQKETGNTIFVSEKWKGKLQKTLYLNSTKKTQILSCWSVNENVIAFSLQKRMVIAWFQCSTSVLLSLFTGYTCYICCILMSYSWLELYWFCLCTGGIFLYFE